MFKKTISYENFAGEKRSKDFYFHLSKAELLNLSADELLLPRLQRIEASRDPQAMLREFEYFIRMSIGIRSENGERFDKSEAAQAELMNSPAYDELLMEFVTKPGFAEEFFGALFPKDVAEKMRDAMTKQEGAPDPFKEPVEDTRPAWMKEHRQPTQQELIAMDKSEMLLAFRTHPNLASE